MSNADPTTGDGALSLGIFAMNTLVEPQGSSGEDLDYLDANTGTAVDTLANVRVAFRDSFPPIFAESLNDADVWIALLARAHGYNANIITTDGRNIRGEIIGAGHREEDGQLGLMYAPRTEDWETTGEPDAWIGVDAILLIKL